MRILLLSDDPDDARMGASKAARKLQAALRELGHDCDAWFRADLGLHPRSERLRLGVAPLLAARAVARARARERRGYDVIDAAGAEAYWLARRSRAARGGATLVVRSHGLEHRHYAELLRDADAGWFPKSPARRLLFPRLRLPLAAGAFQRADGAILLSRAERDFVLERAWLPPDRLAVVPLGVEAALCRAAPPPGAPRGAGVLLCGSAYSTKGLPVLAAAHTQLLESGCALPLTLLGPAIDAPAPAIETWVRRGFAPSSQPWLTILPRLASEEAVFEQYRRHDLLVCPSSSEGFGLVVIEAMSQRCPVVCSTAAGVAELLTHERDALLVPPRDPGALARALALLWQNVSLREKLAEAGYYRVRTLHWRAAAEATLAAYARFGPLP